MRELQALGAIAVLVAAVVYWNFGTISPCGVLRETVRQRDGFAAVLPDSIVDLGLAGQYGALSPGRCLALLLNNHGTPTPNTAQAPPQPMTQPIPRAAPAVPMTAQDAGAMGSASNRTSYQ